MAAVDEHAEDYFLRTRRPLTMLVALLPVILLVEAGFLLSPDGDAQRVLARLQIQELLAWFTLAPIVVVHALGVLVVIVLLVQHALEGRRWRITWFDPPLLWLEGCMAAVPLLVIGAALLPMSTPLMIGAASDTMHLPMEALVVAAVAALSEELLFRMGGMSLLHWLFVDVCKLKTAWGTTAAVVLTSVAFLIYHDPWALTPGGGMFVFLAGLYLGTLFVQRTFATAVLAHMAYDVVALA